ncbi:MAG: glutamate synthase [Deltaproteobacteria bacterium]|nr:glutamate synthase [Deltaproteobacteria bacterium]
MCRLFAVTSDAPLSPMRAVDALNVMKEGHDGSGVGLFMTGLGGELERYKNLPILSGIVTSRGLEKVDQCMSEKGFTPLHQVSFERGASLSPFTPKREMYLVRVYDTPKNLEWDVLTEQERQDRYIEIRLALREMGLADESIIAYSFWPDAVMIKEIGDPVEVARYLGLDREGLSARIILAQGRQNTNYAITLYACHPFFVQGYATMTNGENTAFGPIREFLSSRRVPGYVGYESDSEVFTHILHYVHRRLGLNLETYKHVITPLKDESLSAHPDGEELRKLKHVMRPLIIDGPNCVIGCLPDHTLLMVQDSKKLRPGVCGGRPGRFVFSSEMCGLEYMVPNRDKTRDIQPMGADMVTVGEDGKEMRLWSQWDRYTLTRAA